jgi:hypothetical protein
MKQQFRARGNPAPSQLYRITDQVIHLFKHNRTLVQLTVSEDTELSSHPKKFSMIFMGISIRYENTRPGFVSSWRAKESQECPMSLRLVTAVHPLTHFYRDLYTGNVTGQRRFFLTWLSDCDKVKQSGCNKVGGRAEASDVC